MWKARTLTGARGLYGVRDRVVSRKVRVAGLVSQRLEGKGEGGKGRERERAEEAERGVQ